MSGISMFPPSPSTHEDIQSGVTTKNLGFEGIQANFDIIDLLSKGGVPGHRAIFEFGRRAGLSGSALGEDIWIGSAIKIPRPPAAGELMSITCANANDTAGGTGIRSLWVFYLDANGDEQSIEVATNGGTVNIPAVMFRFINAFHGASWGALGVSAGIIQIHSTATPANIYSQIIANGNYAEDCTFMVPNGHQLFITNVSATATDNKKILIVLRATSTWVGDLCDEFIFKRGWELQDDSIAERLSPQLVMPAFAVVKATALGASAGGDCTINYSGWIEPI